ncbi:hypothetical protein ACFLWC_03390 [Chloroflexota bacterium]
MPRLASSLKPYLIVFIASACGLVIEIVAARILAPSIGVSSTPGRLLSEWFWLA